VNALMAGVPVPMARVGHKRL